MRNQPRYTFFKNARYATEGLKEIFATETSFKIEAVLIAAVWIILLFLPIAWWAKAILGLSPLLILITEALNSAIERVVDLVTKEHHPLAKQAKDAGSAAVFLAIVLTAGIWIATIGTLVIGD